MSAQSALAWVLSRWGFIGTHLVFTYWLLFMFNDPLNLLPPGFNTVDVKASEIKPEGQCTPINWDNVKHNLAWYMVWYLSHTIMARRVYKQAVGLWNHPLDRPIFAAIAPIAWFVTLLKWKPITDCERFDVFNAHAIVGLFAAALFTLGCFEVLGLLYSLPDHVFGTARWKYNSISEMPAPQLIEGFPYNLVRHPAAAGFLWMYWSVIAVGNTANIWLIGAMWTAFIVPGTLMFEEGGLKDEHGPFVEAYLEYRTRVNAFYPSIYSLKRTFGLQTSTIKAD